MGNQKKWNVSWRKKNIQNNGIVGTLHIIGRCRRAKPKHHTFSCLKCVSFVH